MNLKEAFNELNALYEGVFDFNPNAKNWVSMSTGQRVGANVTNSMNNKSVSKPATTSNKLYYAVSAIKAERNHDSFYFWDFGYELGDLSDVMQFNHLFNTLQEAKDFAIEIFNDPDYEDEEFYIMSVDIINTDIKYVTTVTNPKKANTASASKNIVTIVKDSGKLRAQADDGTHGKGFVAFPVALRNAEGQQYEVETLTWNGKNYRASGKITPINNQGNVNQDLRYCVATEEFPDTYDGVFVFSNVHTDKTTGKPYLKYGIDSFWSLEKHDFDYDIADARDRVRDIMRQWPNEELHIIEVDENNNLKAVQSFR